MTKYAYKIRRKKDGKFLSNRASLPSFTETGSVWNNRPSTGNWGDHKKEIAKRDECEVIKYELKEVSREGL